MSLFTSHKIMNNSSTATCRSMNSGTLRYFLSLSDQRDFQGEDCSLSDGAVYFNSSIMRIYNRFHITQSKSEAFNIMDITRMSTIKFFKNPSLGFFGHANS